ncbi:hypothetical protein [Croceitalea dokdonensis]|nr:hypothetical protein [Croceitalea dokdonensis]
MKKNIRSSVLVFFLILITSCSTDDGPTRNDISIVPNTFLDRENEVLGEINVANREIAISVWDHGRIDGDIVTIYVNGEALIAERLLEGPGDKFTVSTTLEFDGYNYILLYAHNEGSISPNTASMSIDDGVNVNEFILEANLLTNGAVDLIVN